MKKICFFLFLICCQVGLFAQEREVQGIVFDKDTKHRLVRVYIYNMRTHKGIYNNSKGEFTTNLAKGDTLVAALSGYGVDTLTVQMQGTLLFYLKRTSIQLPEVTVTDTIKNPAARLAKTKKEYSEIYRKGSTKDMLQVGGPNGMGGAGLGIDALWNLLSREGKNARNLQKIIERDYRDMIINYRYTFNLVGNVTGLSNEDLKDFMLQYRPSYNFIIEANDYMLIAYIKNAYEQYRKNPSLNRLPALVPGGNR